MTPRHLSTLREALAAMEALHRGDVGTKAEWQARWLRHAKATMGVKVMVAEVEKRRVNRG